MRYTKIALLTFGAGLVLGLVAVVVEIDALDRPASALMALGLAAIPIAMILDWRRATKPAGNAGRRPAKRPGGAGRRPARPAAQKAPPGVRRNPRPRKPAPPKR